MERLGLLALVSVVAFSLSVTPAMAQSSANPDGINPDSFFYGFDLFFDNLMLAITSGDLEKAELSLKIAEERLEEARAMIEQGKLSEAGLAQAEHDKALDVTQDSVAQISEENGVDEIKEKIKIEKELGDHKTRVESVSAVLKIDVRIKGDVTDEQQALVDSILASMEGKTGEVKIVIDSEKEKTKTKIKQQTGKSDDEVDDEVKKIETEAGVEDEDELEIEVEIEDGVAKVEVESGKEKIEFELETDSTDAVISEIVDRTGLTREQVESSIEVDVEGNGEDEKEEDEENDNENDESEDEEEDNEDDE